MSIPAGKLFEYGIQNETSDIRAHVSVVHKCIYVFRTAAAVAAIEKHKAKLKTVSACQPGVEGITATGWPMPIEG